METNLPDEHPLVELKNVELPSFSVSHRSPTAWREKYREYISELFATFIFVSIGTGSVAHHVLNSESVLIAAIGYGIGLTIGVMVAAPASGGHVSPAITLSLACFRSFPMRKVPGYMLCQFIGSFLAATLVFLINFSKLEKVGFTTKLSVFATIPKSHLAAVFFVQMFGNVFLLAGVQAAANTKNFPKWLFPFAAGVLVTGLVLAFPGAALSPAIDLSGRLFASLIGKTTSPFTDNHFYFLIPVIAPTLGAILGVAAYDFLIIPSP